MSATTPRDSSSGPTHGPQRSSRWSEIEDNILKQAVAQYGVNHWEDVAKMIWTGKSAEECRAGWAELVPVLYEGLARRESALEQRRTRSITVSAVAPGTSISRQGGKNSQPLSLPAQERQELEEALPLTRAKGNAKFSTEPSSPVPLTPTEDSQSPPLASASARNRRNTEPARPFRTKSVSCGRGEGEREWFAPHPLMPGRPRNTPTSSRDNSTFRNRNDTARRDSKTEKS
ncbi:hypothetical protein Daesc_008928 [Daldinia eschscholtzii]|uniref:Myb-like domain-containing protein n=1 Tax=Daldinia eschscholtzii TaxID=292717 RepID=A0AAX6M8Z5_9PEZI